MNMPPSPSFMETSTMSSKPLLEALCVAMKVRGENKKKSIPIPET